MSTAATTAGERQRKRQKERAWKKEDDQIQPHSALNYRSSGAEAIMVSTAAKGVA
jgi:hypothetical protein